MGGGDASSPNRRLRVPDPVPDMDEFTNGT